MKITRAVFGLPLLAMALSVVPAMAQEHHDRDQDRRDNHTYREHREWRHGSRIQQDDWNRGEQLDYRQHHLRRPRQGYEWRMIDGQYVMARPDGTIVNVRRAQRERHERYERQQRHERAEQREHRDDH